MFCSKEKKEINDLTDKLNKLTQTTEEGLKNFGNTFSNLQTTNRELLKAKTILEEKKQEVEKKFTDLHEQNQELLREKDELHKNNIKLMSENERLKNTGELRAVNEKLLHDNDTLKKTNQELMDERTKLVNDNENIKKEIQNPKIMIDLITQLKTNILNDATINSDILGKLLTLHNEIDSKRWYIPKVPLDIHHDNNYEVIIPQNEKECFVKIKSPVEYVKGFCYIEKKQVMISEGYDHGPNGYQAPTYGLKEFKTFKADNTSKDVRDSNRADFNYYRLRNGLQTPIDAMLAKCYADAQSKENSNSEITLTDHNSEADVKNKLLLQRIQSEMTRIIRALEENIKLETNKTNIIMEHINKMKQQFESMCWIIPRVPLDVNHPENYEEIILRSNETIDIDFNKTYYIKHENKFIPGILKKSVETIYHPGYGYGQDGAYYQTVNVIKFTAHDVNNQKYVVNGSQTYYKLKYDYQTQDEFELAQCYKEKIQSRKSQQVREGGKRRKSHKLHKNMRKNPKYHRK